MARSDLTIVISGDTRGLKRATTEADRDLDKFGRSTKSRLSSMAKAAGAAGVAFGAAGLAFGIKKAVDEWRDAEKVGKQTEAVLKSTGAVANVTAGQVSRLAEKLSLVAGVDDELIQRGVNMLLTFKNIRNEVGKNNDIFNQTVRTTLDMAAAMAAANDSEINLKTASIQVGKALNDPVKGMSALSRVGVTFSESQQKVIERLVESGRRMQAQKLILRELKSEFGGSARANADSMDRLGVAIDNLFEKFGKKLAPIITEAATKLIRFIIQMNNGRGAGGKFVRTLEDIWRGVKVVIDIFEVWIPIALKLPKLWVRIGVTAVEAAKAIIGAMRGAFNVVKKASGDAIAFVLRRFADFLDVASKIPIIGDKFKGLADDVRKAANRVDQLGEEVRKLPAAKDIKVKVRFNPIGVDPFGPNLANPIGDGPGAVGAFIDGASRRYMGRWAKRNQDKLMGLGLGGGRGSADLMGAGAHLAPFAKLGARMGLSVTSGYWGRENDITSTGNRSYHGMGRAIDMADGPQQMMAYAATMSRLFGSRLKELIYTPLGSRQIHNGQPYVYTGITAQEHYDHVHVAMQRGGLIPGQGSGDKVPVLAEPGEGFINRRAVAAMGGKRVIDWINQMIPRFQSGGTVPGYSGSQSSIINAIFRAAKRSNATRDQVIAAMMIGLVESKFSNPTMADSDRDSAGWRQERSHYGSESERRNPGAAAMRVFRELKGVSGSPGAMAQAVQRSAYPGRYAERAGEALQLWDYYKSTYLGKGGRGPDGKPEPLSRAERREREQRRIARTPVKGRTTLPSIGETRQDFRYERQQERLEGIRDDDRVTGRERRRAERSYLARAKVLNARVKAKRRRLRQINRALKGKLRPATRQRLLQEKGQLVSDIGSLQSDLRQITYTFREQTAPFEPEAVEPESPFAQVEMQAALASLTPGTADDLAAAQARLGVAEGGLKWAQGAGEGPASITAWANEVKSARDAIEGLTGAIEADRQQREEHTRLLAEINKNQKTIISTASVQGPALERALLMIVSGGLGGNAGLGRSFPSFAGLGGLART